MTITSINQRWIDVNTDFLHRVGEQGTPFDVAKARIVINNALHFADEAGQVLVAFSPPAGQAMSYTTDAANTYQLAWQFGPFYPLVAATGAAYPIRVRVAHSVSAGAGTIAIVYSARAVAYEDLSELNTNVITFVTSSTTAAWRTGSTLITPSVATTESMIEEVSVQSDVSGTAVRHSIRVPASYVTIFVKDTLASEEINLDGLYVAEYVGL